MFYVAKKGVSRILHAHCPMIYRQHYPPQYQTLNLHRVHVVYYAEGPSLANFIGDLIEKISKGFEQKVAGNRLQTLFKLEAKLLG